MEVGSEGWCDGGGVMAVGGRGWVNALSPDWKTGPSAGGLGGQARGFGLQLCGLALPEWPGLLHTYISDSPVLLRNFPILVCA